MKFTVSGKGWHTVLEIPVKPMAARESTQIVVCSISLPYLSKPSLFCRVTTMEECPK